MFSIWFVVCLTNPRPEGEPEAKASWLGRSIPGSPPRMALPIPLTTHTEGLADGIASRSPAILTTEGKKRREDWSQCRARFHAPVLPLRAPPKWHLATEFPPYQLRPHFSLPPAACSRGLGGADLGGAGGGGDGNWESRQERVKQVAQEGGPRAPKR